MSLKTNNRDFIQEIFQNNSRIRRHKSTGQDSFVVHDSSIADVLIFDTGYTSYSETILKLNHT